MITHTSCPNCISPHSENKQRFLRKNRDSPQNALVTNCNRSKMYWRPRANRRAIKVIQNSTQTLAIQLNLRFSKKINFPVSIGNWEFATSSRFKQKTSRLTETRTTQPDQGWREWLTRRRWRATNCSTRSTARRVHRPQPESSTSATTSISGRSTWRWMSLWVAKKDVLRSINF